MKKRYLKIISAVVWATNAITKDDLEALKNGRYEAILDLQEWKMFSADDNAWKDIP